MVCDGFLSPSKCLCNSFVITIVTPKYDSVVMTEPVLLIRNDILTSFNLLANDNVQFSALVWTT